MTAVGMRRLGRRLKVGRIAGCGLQARGRMSGEVGEGVPAVANRGKVRPGFPKPKSGDRIDPTVPTRWPPLRWSRLGTVGPLWLQGSGALRKGRPQVQGKEFTAIPQERWSISWKGKWNGLAGWRIRVDVEVL